MSNIQSTAEEPSPGDTTPSPRIRRNLTFVDGLDNDPGFDTERKAQLNNHAMN